MQIRHSRSGLARAALLALFVVSAGSVGAEESFRDPVLDLQSHTLDNGLRVLTLEDHTTPVVSFQMWVAVGSVDETRYTGIAHLFEHMMFRGSENLGPEEHARLVSARGGRYNAFTSQDVTVYFEDVTAESLPLVIDLEAERLSSLRINQKNLDTERQVVLEERRLRTDDSARGRGFEALTGLVWSAHTYRRPVIGWRSDIEQVDVAACRSFFDTYYAPNNIALVLVGDFDTESALARIERRFGALRPADEIPRSPTVEPEQRGERRATVHFELRSPVLLAGWHAPPTGHPDAEALDVASQVLSGGRSSRLYRSLVYDAQQALYAQGGYWELEQDGIFYAMAGVRPDASIERVESLFFEEVDRLGRDGASVEEVEKAQRQLEVSLIAGLDTAHALASRIGRETLSFGRVRGLEERLAAIRAVTPEDVKRVVAQYLVPEKRSVVHVVSPPPPAESAAENAAENDQDAASGSARAEGSS